MSAAHEGYFGTVENTKGCRTLRFTLVHETKKKVEITREGVQLCMLASTSYGCF